MEAATHKFLTVLELGWIAHVDLTIQKLVFQIQKQESSSGFLFKGGGMGGHNASDLCPPL